MSLLKELFLGITVITVVGIGGFVYRAAMESPLSGTSVMCTLQVKICPDGTTVGRVGLSCAFAQCPLPNISLPSVGVAFALPLGLASSTNVSRDSARVASYGEHTGSTASSTTIITIYRYAIPAGKTVGSIISAEIARATKNVPSAYVRGIATTTIGSNTFTRTVVTRMNGRVVASYYLPRPHDVLRFEMVEYPVARWADKTFVLSSLSGYRAVYKMLSTLSASK